MVYDADAGIVKGYFKGDLILEGTVLNFQDGQIKDFVKNSAAWKEPEQPAINVTIQVMHDGTHHDFTKLFPYRNEGTATVAGTKSDLGKYQKKYGHFPKAGDKVKVVTTAEGYLRLKLD